MYLAKSTLLSKYYDIFNKMKHMFSKSHEIIIFNHVVYSNICYGIELYGSSSQYMCKKLQIICNKLMNILFI